MKLKCKITAIIFFVSTTLFSQTNLQAIIRDADSKEILAYCPFIIKGTYLSGISNEEGVFNTVLRSENDTLIFSYVNYKTQIISAKSILESHNVFLKRKENLLTEVVVSSKSDFFYRLMEKCRNSILQIPEFKSKVYLEVETERADRPVNMVETYYNAKVKGSSIEELKIKNGRAGLARGADFGYFVSDDASKAISLFSLTDKVDHIPANPLQYTVKKLKKHYQLQMVNETDQFYVINFKPKKNADEYFKGEIWIEKTTFGISKINLFCKNTEVHPFVPYAGASIKKFSLYISQTYIKSQNQQKLNLIKFAFSHEYVNNTPNTRINNGSELSPQFRTECTMYFFDYNKPFLLPYFEYRDELSDYRKISFLPYNASFWDKADELVLTKKQNLKLEFFKTNGFLFNHNAGNGDKTLPPKFFEDNYTIWSDTMRIRLRKKEKPPVPSGAQVITLPTFRSEDVVLKAQIFLDINPVGDSLQHFSVSVFDVFETIYELPEDDNTGCFINLFFDIYEIERRKMEKSLALVKNNLQKMDSVYKQTMFEIDAQTKLYIKEVQRGKNLSKFIKWNNYVRENMGIDNRKLFKLDERK